MSIHSLDKLWQYIIKARAGFCCEICGASDKGLHAAHIIGRRGLWTRWQVKNGLAVCPDCHVDSKIKDWLKANDPNRYQWIIKQRAKVRHGQRIDLEAIRRNLELRM